MDGRKHPSEFQALLGHRSDSDSGGESDPPGSIAKAHQDKLNRMNYGRKSNRRRETNERPVIRHLPSNTYYSQNAYQPTTSLTHSNSISGSSVGGSSYTQPNSGKGFPHSASDATIYRQEEDLKYDLQSRDLASAATISGSRVTTGSTDSLKQHKRSRSDGGGGMLKLSSQSFKSIKTQIQLESPEETLFCEPISEKLLCKLCNKVFREPVITNCGHTFCRQCVLSSQESCPTDGTHLSVVVANIAVQEQVGELLVHCKYGYSPASIGVPGEFEVNPNGCPQTMKLNARKEHEDTCEYAPIQCPNSSLCPRLIKMDLQVHLAQCRHTRCPHSRFNCEFQGTSDEVTEHLITCRFEAMKEFLEHSENQMKELKKIIIQKDQESEYLRGMVSKLTERFESLEKTVEIRVDLMDANLTKLSSDFIETRRCLSHIEKELSSMDSRAFNVGAFDVQAVLKCKGTFVGHQGPVCSLCVFSSLLFSGSSDNSIKVWDTRSNFKCIATFQEHTGMVLTLCAYRGKLYSGSADCSISVFDIENMKLIQNFRADENPICTIAVGNGMLFSGSLKSIKVWNLETLKFMSSLGPMNHWVRALYINDSYLYCGSYQTIKVWDLSTLEQVKEIQTQGGSVYSLVVSSDYIIVGTYENCIHIWDKKNYNSVVKLTGHVGIVYSLVLMTLGDASRVISASYDGSLRVWSLDNMQCVQTLFRHRGSVTTLAVSRGRLFSGSVDSTVKVWQ